MSIPSRLLVLVVLVLALGWTSGARAAGCDIGAAGRAERVSVPVSYVPDFSAVARTVGEVARPGDVIVTMGAGDVTLLGREILTALEVKADRAAPGRPTS